MLNQKILINLKANLTGFNLALYQKDNWQNYSFGNIDDRIIKTNLTIRDQIRISFGK